MDTNRMRDYRAKLLKAKLERPLQPDTECIPGWLVAQIIARAEKESK